MELIRKAIALKPAEPVFHCNLGLVLIHQKKWEEAITASTRAIALRPGYVEAWNNLGNALFGMNRCHEAADACLSVLVAGPESCAAALIQSKAMLCGTGPLPEAVAAMPTGVAASAGRR